jgi:hypothetical protein
MVATLFNSYEDMMKAITLEKASQFSVVVGEDGWLYSRPEKFVKIMKAVK